MMLSPPSDPMTLVTLMSNQSTVMLNPGRKLGFSTTPIERVSACSGFRFGLPPCRPLYWLAGLARMLPYWAAVTPVKAQLAAEADGEDPEQGSVDPSSSTPWVVNSSLMFGVRIAR